MSERDLQEVVRKKYGEALSSALASRAKSSCCGSAPSSCGPAIDPITRDLYDALETAGLPDEALLASFGCGNPSALAELRPGETVLDLGSGGGIDVLLSARRVGPSGKAFGLDMTPEMLAVARENARKAGASNVEFLQGTIEQIPLPESSVDVLISNCVINLSGDKPKVLREAFRVLKPGGRFAVSDIVLRRELPEALRRSIALWTGCVAGALVESEYRELLARAGFESIGVEPTRVYTREDARQILASSSCGGDTDRRLEGLDGAVMSAFIRARKPA